MQFFARHYRAPVVVLAIFFSHAGYAASLGEAELRSWLGEPLSVRIPVASSNEEVLDRDCISINPASEPFSISREIRVELSGAEGAKRFMLRTNNAINEPFIKLVIRFACAGQGALTREYTLLLDPRPDVSPPAVTASTNSVDKAPTAAAQPPETAQPARQSRQWLTTERNPDTLNSIAEGVYPKSIKRKARYIAALRTLNPDLANLANNAPLPPGMALSLPDLKALSTTREVIAQGVARTAAVATAATSRPQAPKDNTTRAQPAKVVSAPAPTKTVRKSPATNAAPAQFELRLSGGEIDLGRSANVTEEQRAILREKQFLLDADDQIAQFLSLKNTVAQLEKRLNEVQLRMSTTPTVAPAATSPTIAPTIAATIAPTAAANVASTQSWRDRLSFGWLFASVIFLAMILSAVIWRNRRKQAADVAQRVSALSPTPEVNPSPAARAEPPEHDEFSNWAQSPPQMQTPAATATLARSDVERMQDEADDLALALLRRKTESNVTPPVTEDRFSATIKLDAPVELPPLVLGLNAAPSQEETADTAHFNIFEDAPVQFKADDSAGATVDFVIGDLGEPDIAFDEPKAKAGGADEERMRRLQYMFERYPELQTKVVSIDNPDSIINAARLYVEESSVKTTQDRRASAGVTNSDGAQKATELLAYALEERPQETRFWLAQFQVFRNANMADEYSELANKFNILFGHTSDWPLIQEIGSSLAPANPLFAPLPDHLVELSDNKNLTGKLKVANWLNVPSKAENKLADQLAHELRMSLINPPNR